MTRDCALRSIVLKGVQAILWASLGLAAGLLALAMLERSFGHLRAMLLLTGIGLAVGSTLLVAQLRASRFAPGRAATILLVAGILAVVASQSFYLMLVWTGWKGHSALWRAWWLAMVPSLVLTHLLLLRAAAADARGAFSQNGGGADIPVGERGQAGMLAPPYATAPTRRGRGTGSRRAWLEWFTGVCVVIAGGMWAWLGVRADLLRTVHAAYLIVGAVPASAVVIGSILVVILRARRVGWRMGRMSRRATIAALAISHACLLALGVYVGRKTVTPEDPMLALPSSLANLSPAEIDEQARRDLARLRTIVEGLGDLERRMDSCQAELDAKLAEEGRSFYRPEEDDRLRWLFVSHLSYQAALHRLMATYSGYGAVRDLATRARCFMLGHAATMTACRSGIALIKTYRDRPLLRRKLNEPEPAWGIPAGMFDRICERMAGDRFRELVEETAAYFEDRRERWRETGVWPAEDFDWLERAILADREYVHAHPLGTGRLKFELFLERVRQDAYGPAYATQSLISEWLGDTRIIEREPFVSIEQIDAIEPRLRPGDILFERRNWFLSNAFLPGFWPHAAIYVGTIDDLKRLGIADAPEVRQHMDDYLAAAPDGRPHTVIEAMSEGVVFNSLAHSIHADYVAALRPRVSDEQIAQAIVRAFRHVGKPYDFEFDFFSSDKLVCTEVVYRCYEGALNFNLVRVMGRDTLPAIEMLRKFADERGRADRQLDFIFFLDTSPGERRAREADAEALVGSLKRSREFNE